MTWPLGGCRWAACSSARPAARWSSWPASAAPPHHGRRLGRRGGARHRLHRLMGEAAAPRHQPVPLLGPPSSRPGSSCGRRRDSFARRGCAGRRPPAPWSRGAGNGGEQKAVAPSSSSPPRWRPPSPSPRRTRRRAWCCGPRMSSPSANPLAGSPQAALLVPAGPTTPHDARRRASPSRRRRRRSATRSWPGAPTATSWRLREGAPGALRRVRARSAPFLALRQPVRGTGRCRPRPRHGAHAHARRAARPPGLVRGLLRRAQPRIRPCRRPAPGRAHQHVLVQHLPGPDARVGGGHRPGRRDRRDLVQACCRPGSARWSPSGASSLQRSAAGRRQVLFATVALRRGFTPYDDWGDLPVLLLAAVAVVAGWARQLRYS